MSTTSSDEPKMLHEQINEGVQSVAQSVHTVMGKSLRVQVKSDGSLSQEWLISEIVEAKKFQAHVLIQIETLIMSLEAIFLMLPEDTQQAVVQVAISALKKSAEGIRDAKPLAPAESSIILP